MRAFSWPRVCRGKKEWYVYWTETDPATGKTKLFKSRGGINRIHNLKLRNVEANKLCRAILRALQSGITHFKTAKQLREPTPGTPKVMTLAEALAWALEKRIANKKKKPLRHRSINEFNASISRFTRAAIEIDLNRTITTIKRLDIEHIMDHMHQGFGNARYNAILACVKLLLKVCVQNDIIEYNPAAEIDRAVKTKPTVHIPPTAAERKLIAAHLRQAHYRLYVIAKTVFKTGTRPNEILHLKPSMIDQVGPGFLLPAESVKDDDDRYVAVDPELMVDLLTCADGCPENWHIFGTTGTLMPAIKKMDRNRVSDLWRELVKNPTTGIGINRTLYASKHDGTDRKRELGLDLKTIGGGYGHNDEQTTAGYSSVEAKLRNEQLRKVMAKMEFE